MSTKMDNIDLNFTLNAKAVEQSGKQLRHSLESGLGQVDFGILRKSANKTFQRLGQDLKKSLDQKISFDTSEIDKKLTQLHSKRLTMERQLALESAKMQDIGGKKQGIIQKAKMRFLKKIKQEEQRLIKLKQKGMEKLNKLANKHVAIMKKAGSGKGGGIMKMFGGGGKGKGGGMLGMLGGGKGGGMMKALGSLGKMGKVLGPIMGVLGGVGAAIGGVVAALGTMVAAIGAVVGIFMGLVAIIMAADSKMKEFNKELIASAGGADMLGKGFDNATSSIDNMRDAAIKAQFRLGSLAKDNIKVLTSLHEHGYTIREISKDATSATSAIGHYTKAMSLVMSTSRMIGESASTVAQHMATQADDLGMTLTQVAEKFSTIGRFAMESGFSTKRFFSMVIQATSGMSMYNVRLEEASGLLVRIGKILGQKTGGEFLQSLSKGFVDKSMTDRIKQVKLAGTGNTKRTMETSANSTADAFIQKMQGNKAMKGMTLADLGMKGDDRKISKMNSQELVKVLKNMTPQQQAKFNSKFHMEATKNDKANADGLARQMKILTDISVGSKGGLLNMAKNLDSLDMGGKLNMLRNSMKTMFPGKEIHELSTLQLAALENATGMQGEQLKQMRNMTAAFDGNFQTLQEVANTGYVNAQGQKMTQKEIKAAQEAQVRAFGAFTTKNGEIVAASVDASGQIVEKRNADGTLQIIKSLEGYYNSQGDRVQKNVEAANFNEDRAISQEIANNTFSIADMISAGVTNVLNMIYKAVMSIVKAVWQNKDDSMEEAIRMQGDLMRQAAKAQMEAAKRQGEIAKKERSLKGEKDEGKRAKIEEEIKTLKLEKERLTRVAMESTWGADNVFTENGDVDKDALKVKRSGGLFSSSSMREDIKFDEGETTMKGYLAEKMLKDEEFQQEIKDATPHMTERGEKAKGEKIITDEEKTKFDAIRKGQATTTKNQSMGSVSVNADRSMTKFTLRDGDGRDVQNTMAGDFVGGSFHSKDYKLAGVGGEKVTHRQILEAHKSKGWGVHGSGMAVDRQSESGEASGDILREQGFTTTGALDVSDNMNNASFNGKGASYGNAVSSGLTNEQILEADLKQSWIIDRTQSNYSHINGGALGTYRTHQPTAVTAVGEHTTALQPSNATLSTFATNADGSAKEDMSKVKDQYTETAVLLRQMGVDLKQSADNVRVNRETDEIGRWSVEADGWVTSAISQDDAMDQFANYGSGGVQQGGAHTDQGTDLIGFYQELKTMINAGQVKKEDGSDYTLADLNGDLKTHLADVGSDNLSGASFETYFKTEKQTAWADIKKNRAAVEKMKTHAKKQRDFLKKIEEHNDPQKQKDASAKSLMSYIGRGSDSYGTGQLSKGKVPSGQAKTALKEALFHLNEDGTVDESKGIKDQSVAQALQTLGISVEALKQDFFYRGGAHGGVITPILGKDSLLGAKPGGPVDQVLSGSGGGGGGNIIVEVHSTLDLEKVKRAIFQASRIVGVGGRVQNRAGKGNFGGGGASGGW